MRETSYSELIDSFSACNSEIDVYYI